MRRVFLSTAVALLGLAGAAQAHPKLVSASPAPNATVTKPARVALRFTEKLMPKFSGADLMMTGHGGTTHAPMKVAGTASVGADGRTLVVTPKSPLGAGSYSLAWHVVSTDTHRVAGNYVFAVK
ncbi:copper homeostasis periplasmic binding protein CopC [Sphingomonas aurantiaca]|jgi:methionine-rich copper-binding protein CopC|uniref:copper homeostasis periplasmic binding protein CopC n=1 Tax=Sphingomonas aurantiaca TaxID=185949 RepID=UPI002FE2F269